MHSDVNGHLFTLPVTIYLEDQTRDALTLMGQIKYLSSTEGGENTSDSTTRLTLQSYQRAQSPNHFGETIRLDLMTSYAKNLIAWREAFIAGGGAVSPRSVTWLGAHGLSNDKLTWHNHFSIEVPDETGQLQTQFEIPYAPWDTANGYGISAADVYVRSVAKFIGATGLYSEGSAGNNRDLTFLTGSRGITTGYRWSLRADTTAEGGSNAGSDFRIVRYSDTGVALDTPFFINRASALVGIGTTSPTRILDINGDSIRLRTAKTPATAGATGDAGQIAWDSGFVYVCVATNTWKRVAIATW